MQEFEFKKTQPFAERMSDALNHAEPVPWEALVSSTRFWVESQAPVLLMIGAFAILCQIVFYFSRKKTELRQSENILNAISVSAKKSLHRFMGLLIFCVGLSVYLTYQQNPHWLASAGFAGLVFAFISIDTFIKPLTQFDQHHSKINSHTIIVCSRLLATITLLYFSTPLFTQLPRHIEALIQSICLLSGTITASIFLRCISLRFTHISFIRKIFSAATLLMLSCFFAEITGFRSYAHWAFFGSLGTLVVLILWWVLQTVVSKFLRALEDSTHPWHQKVHQRFRIEPDEAKAHIPWISFVIQSGILILAVCGILAAWGVSTASFLWLRSITFEGFSIGKSNIVPVKIVLGIIIFFVVFRIGQTLAKRVTKGRLLINKLDSASIETLSKVISYLSFMIAALVGLTFAGFNFQNLAIIAGALSVGIGFGLQNVVNNFVSGIILLFERPVRTGDWVAVGGTEGIVKNIRVRSTEIQTWDHTDVVIPNSEFISQQVTNYTLRDPHGRVIVAVGVAYGSDTELVKTILESVASAHSAVIPSNTFGTLPGPTVLFRGFGDSSLNFELRCFIKNIRERLQVISDLNFAIDQQFREQKVEIPFPQRDLHLRSSIKLPK